MFLSKQQLTAIDIGAYSIKVVRLINKKNDIELLATGMETLPFETVQQGYIQDISIVAKKLDKIFNDLKYKPGNIIMTVPCENLIIRNIDLPLMAEEELQEAIKWESEEYLPFPVQDAAIDYIVLSRLEEQMKLLLVAVKKDIINNHKSVLEKINLSPKVINVQPMALLSLLQYQTNIDEPLAIIDIGAASTNVTIGDKENIYLARTIDIGGNEFTRLLMEEEELEYQQAEEYKIQNGIGEKLEEGEEDLDLNLVISEVAATGGSSINLRPLAGNLSEEILRSLNYYSMKFRGKEIENVYITGGGSKLKNLHEIITNETGKKIKKIDPYYKLNISSNIHQLAEEFSVVIGLAISEVINNES